MGANKLEKFDYEKVARSAIHGADYNPRKISEAAKKKLKKNIKENGLIQPIIVNRRTMNVVGGHQRLSILDDVMKDPGYELTVAMIDVDEKKEVELNVFLNNTSAQGEWDLDLLKGLEDIFPDIDYEIDLGFDAADLDIMFGEEFQSAAKIEFDEFSADPVQMAKQAAKAPLTAEDFRAMKKEMREKAKQENERDGSYNIEKSDYVLNIVFPNNHEKHEFMAKIGKKRDEKYLKSTIFHDIATGKVSIF